MLTERKLFLIVLAIKLAIAYDKCNPDIGPRLPTWVFVRQLIEKEIPFKIEPGNIERIVHKVDSN